MVNVGPPGTAPTIETTRISAVARASSARRHPAETSPSPVGCRLAASSGIGWIVGLAFTALVAGTATVLLGSDRPASCSRRNS